MSSSRSRSERAGRSAGAARAGRGARPALHAGRGDQQAPARSEDAPHLVDPALRVGHVLDHLARPHDGELPVVEGPRSVWLDAHVARPGGSSARALERCLGDVRAGDLGRRVRGAPARTARPRIRGRARGRPRPRVRSGSSRRASKAGGSSSSGSSRQISSYQRLTPACPTTSPPAAPSSEDRGGRGRASGASPGRPTTRRARRALGTAEARETWRTRDARARSGESRRAGARELWSCSTASAGSSRHTCRGRGPARPLPVLGARHVLAERPLSPSPARKPPPRRWSSPSTGCARASRRPGAPARAAAPVLAADLAVRTGHPLVGDPLHHPLQPALVGRERVSGQRDDHRGRPPRRSRR